MPNGCAGKLLFVDLSTGEIRSEPPDDTLYRDFIDCARRTGRSGLQPGMTGPSSAGEVGRDFETHVVPADHGGGSQR